MYRAAISKRPHPRNAGTSALNVSWNVSTLLYPYPPNTLIPPSGGYPYFGWSSTRVIIWSESERRQKSECARPALPPSSEGPNRASTPHAHSAAPDRNRRRRARLAGEMADDDKNSAPPSIARRPPAAPGTTLAESRSDPAPHPRKSFLPSIFVRPPGKRNAPREAIRQRALPTHRVCSARPVSP